MRLVEAEDEIRLAGRESRLSVCQEGLFFLTLRSDLPIGRIDPGDARCQYSSDEG